MVRIILQVFDLSSSRLSTRQMLWFQKQISLILRYRRQNLKYFVGEVCTPSLSHSPPFTYLAGSIEVMSNPPPVMAGQMSMDRSQSAPQESLDDREWENSQSPNCSVFLEGIIIGWYVFRLAGFVILLKG